MEAIGSQGKKGRCLGGQGWGKGKFGGGRELLLQSPYGPVMGGVAHPSLMLLIGKEIR